MNSNHCSRLLLALLVVLSVAGTATAVTISDMDAPVTAQVDSSIEATFTFTELYDEYDMWTLRGETNLSDVTWTVRTFDVGGDQAGEESYDGETFEHEVSKDDGISEVQVRIAATVPDVEDDEWSYDPPQQTTVASFQQVRQGGTSNDIGEDITLRPYTDESDRARQAIDEADAAIDSAGGDSQAETKLQQAIGAFNEGSFSLAEELANEARQEAQSSQQRSQLLRLATFGLIAVVLLVLVGGGLYWYRSNQTGSKL